MKKFKVTAVLLSALMLMSAASCNNDKKKDSSSISMIEVNNNSQEIADVGKNKFNTTLGEPIEVGNTTFTVNSLVDVDNVVDDGKYIYVGYTIVNNSDNDFPTDALNNFCITVDGETTVYDVRTNVYANRFINGYSTEFTVAAHSEYSNYIGFVVPESAENIEIGYYATGDNKDKSNIVLCSATPADYIAPPDGMLTE